MGKSSKVEIRDVPEKCDCDSTANNSDLIISRQIEEGSSLINARHNKIKWNLWPCAHWKHKEEKQLKV